MMFEKAIKNFFSDPKFCPDCGWLIACDKCSERFDSIDEDIKRLEKIKRDKNK